jgi:hypothetical protein
VLPAGRRLEELKVADNSPRKLAGGNPVEGGVRIIENVSQAEEEE